MVQITQKASGKKCKINKFCVNLANLVHFADYAKHTVDTEFCTNFCSCRISEWNCLPSDFKMTTNTNSFKKKLKAHFYRQAFLAE